MPEQLFRPPGFPVSGRLTPSAFPFFTTGEDNLRVVSHNTAAGVKVLLTGRGIDSTGTVIPLTKDHTPNTDGSAKSDDIPLSGVTPLNLRVICSAGTPQWGQTFVEVQLIRGLGAAAIVFGTLIQGSITAAQARGYPGSILESTLDGGGYFRQLFATSPPPGSVVHEVCPTGRRWDVVCMIATFNTDANVGLRGPEFELYIAGAKVSFGFPDNAVPANSVVAYTIGQLPKQVSINVGGTLAWIQTPVPCILRGGDFWQLNMINGFAGDSWLSVQYLVREWQEP